MPTLPQIAIRIHPSIRKALEREAAKDERNLSNLIVKILKDWLETKK